MIDPGYSLVSLSGFAGDQVQVVCALCPGFRSRRVPPKQAPAVIERWEKHRKKKHPLKESKPSADAEES